MKNNKFKIKDLIKVILVSSISLLLVSLIFDYFKFDDFFKHFSFPSLIFLAVYLLQSLIIVLPLYFFVIRKYNLKLSDFGFLKFPFWNGVYSVLKGYLAFLGIAFLISSIQLFYDINIPGFGQQESPLPLFGNDIFSIYIAFLVIVFLAPLVEELVYRGYVLQTLLSKMKVFWASILSAGIFACFHLEFSSVIPLFILGLIMNYIFIKNKSIWPSIIFHAFNNGITLIIQYYLILHPELMPKM